VMACGSLGEAVGERGGSWVVGRGGGDGVRLVDVDVMEDCMGAGAGTSTPASMRSWCLGKAAPAFNVQVTARQLLERRL
jgi:hypothetical protein